MGSTAAIPDSGAAGWRSARKALRAQLLAEREAFIQTPGHAGAAAALAAALVQALRALEPHCLGVYWPLRSEFNVPAALAADAELAKVPLALPYARRSPRSLEFRRWDGAPPALQDECGIGSSAGDVVTPDVVVVPCVGYTAASHRLGYGGGYYDRWLAAHPHVVAVGVAWSFAQVGFDAFAAQPHDIALTVVVTERDALSPSAVPSS